MIRKEYFYKPEGELSRIGSKGQCRWNQKETVWYLKSEFVSVRKNPCFLLVRSHSWTLAFLHLQNEGNEVNVCRCKFFLFPILKYFKCASGSERTCRKLRMFKSVQIIKLLKIYLLYCRV